jgi:phospholipid/cholesterol/gamma-HCH transport system substrate-binding protein
VLKGALKNIEMFSQTLATNSERINHILEGAEGLLGGGPSSPGDIAQAARAIKTLADNLDARTAEISTGLSRFSNTGLREWERLATDGRHTLGEVEKTFKNIDRNPSRLIFGGSSAATTDDKASDKPADKPKR